MVYIVFSNNNRDIDCSEYSPSIEYITENKQKALDYLEKWRFHYFNQPDCNIDEDNPNNFCCWVNNWVYDYWIAEFPKDEDVNTWSLRINNIF